MLKAIRALLIPLALLITAPASAADNIYVSPAFFGMNFTQRVARPVFANLESHWGGSWSFVATCRPTNPTNPADTCYNWGTLDLGLTFAQQHGYRLQYNMGYAPSWSNGNQGTQYPPTDPTDYSNWTKAYLTRYKGKIDAVTVWNEVQDTANGTGYAGTLSNLLTLESSLCANAHTISPSTLVLSPSTYGAAGLTYHANYFAAGGGQCVDAFSWHSYPVGDPNNFEQWDNTTNYYKALLGLYGRTGKPIYVTEGGYANSTGDAYAMGSLWPLFMACFATNAQPYAWDRPPGGNTSLDYWLGSSYPNDANGRGIGYKAMQSWLIGATITQCPTRTATTNMVRNPNGTGFTAGVIGSGGVMPTNWSNTTADQAFGVTTQVVGSCTNGAVTGVAIRLYTPTTVQSGASGSTTIAFEGNGQVVGGLGAQMNVGVTVALASGSMTGLTGAQMTYNEYTSGNGYLASTMGASNAPVVPLATPVAWNWKATIASPTAAYVIPKFGISYAVGAAFDATFCLSNAMADTGSVWTATLSRPGGYTALIAWDSKGGPTAYSVPSTYLYQRDAGNNLTPIVGNASTLMQAPRLFESAPWGGIALVDKPNYPTLLNGYAYKPSWQVAGVNYYVGRPSSAGLKDPATMSIAGASVDLANHRIVVDNTATNVLIDGYDFSLNGGWYVLNWTNVGTLTIQNSNFAVGSNHQTPINTYSGTGNITLLNNTFEGNFDMNTTLSTFVSYSGTGTLTVRYNWFKHAVSDVIDINNSAANLIAEFNLFEDTGAAGVHGDIIQFAGSGPYTAIMRYNTTKQAAGLSAQGFMVEPDVGQNTGVITAGENGYNTFTGALSYFVGVTIADLAGPSAFNVHDNYFALDGGAFGFTPGGVRGGPNDGQALSVYTNNVNMVDGSKVQDTPPGTP